MMPTSNLSRSGQKLAGLEILRFVAAFAMLIWHYQHFSYAGLRPIGFDLYGQPFYRTFELFYRYGYLGVQVFWCISGYIFFWKYRESIASRRVGGREFFVLRFSRLYPLHLATLLLVAALQLAYFQVNDSYFVFRHNDLPRFALQLFMASHWGLLKGYSFNSPVWSISAEVLVYFLFYFILRRAGGSVRINVAIVFACAAAKLIDIRHPVLDCLAFFYAGGIAAILSQTFTLRKTELRISAIAMAGLLFAAFLGRYPAVYTWKYFHFFFLLICTPPLLYVLCENVGVPEWSRKFVEAAGNMTYSSYLIHFPLQVGVALAYSALGQKIPLYSPAFFLAFMGSTLLLSFLIYRYFEAPVQRRWRRKYLQPRRTGVSIPTR